MPKRKKEPTELEKALAARGEALRKEVEALARAPNPDDSTLGNRTEAPNKAMQFESPMLSHSLNRDQKRVLMLERELEQVQGSIQVLREENVRLRQRLIAATPSANTPTPSQPTPQQSAMAAQMAMAAQLAMVAQSALARQSAMAPLPSPPQLPPPPAVPAPAAPTPAAPTPAAPVDDRRRRRASVDGAAVLMSLNPSPPPQLTLIDGPKPVETSDPITMPIATPLADLHTTRTSSSSSLCALSALSTGSSCSTLRPNVSNMSLASLGGLSEGTSEELNRLLGSPGLLAQLAEKTYEKAASAMASAGPPGYLSPSPLSPKNGSPLGHSPKGMSPKGMSAGSNFSPKLMALYNQVKGSSNLADNLAAWTGGRLGGGRLDPRHLPV